MMIYYNIHHMLKQFKVKDFIKLLTKHFKLKYPKLSSCWIGSFRILKQIGDQIYQIALLNKYAWLHSIFSVQMLKHYHRHDNTELTAMPMPDLKKSPDEWNVEEV